MTKAPGLRSRVTGNCQARFWIGGGVGDRPTDHNYQMGAQFYAPSLPNRPLVFTPSFQGTRPWLMAHGIGKLRLL